MSSNRVNRYSTTQTSYSLSPTVQSTNQSRPGFGSASRKEWTLNANGTNSVTLNQTYSPPSQNPVSGASIIGLGENTSDSALQSYIGIPSTRCKAVFTGASTVTINASELDNRYDSETSYHTTTLDGLYLSSSSWRQTLNGSNTVIYNSMKGLPTPYTFPTRTLTNSGSAVTMIEASQLQILGGNNTSTVNISVAFDGSANETFTHTHASTGTLVRSWEATDIIMDGSDSDHTIPAFSSAFTFSENDASALVRHGELEVNSAFTITEDTENFKIAPATEMGMVSSIAITPSFIVDITKELSSTTEFQSTTYNFVKMDPVAASSAFTFAVTPTLILGPAVVNLASAATTSFDSNMIFDVLGDYTWNQFSNNPFIVTGYVKGGYTNDAEYEWDDLTTDTWDNWTYGTWLGDEGQWDEWPNNTWNRTFGFISNFTQADTVPLLKVGGASAISSAFTITEDAALARAAAPSLSSAFTITATAQGLIDVTQDLSSAFTLAVSDVDFLENILESELPITAAFTTSFTATIKYALDEEIAISSALTFTLGTVFVKYDIEDTPASAFTTSFIGHIKYDPSLTLSVLASQLSVGLLITQTDPYRVITVDAETRTFVVPTESRSTVVQEENRLNIISSETRLENVLEETRVHKLKIPGLTGIYSTPRVRSET
jgi:hypothetical protein